MNNRPTLRGQNVINAKYGRIYAEIEGRRYDLFNMLNIRAEVSTHNKELQALDRHLSVHLETGGRGTFSGNMYRPTPFFLELLRKKKDTHETTRFTLELYEHDVNYSGGRSAIVLYDCLLDNYTLSVLDAANTESQEAISGTFDDFAIAEAYQPMEGMGR